ncbi:hypothetical protein GCM10028803_01250 [Larkinella knui]|uniref:Uncharacterized protein n=1 Tax=Larkinella knui TaxID=2025310 RepID=A0A3P1CLT4_9BACT|nr:hypothetical protein [Larkinella knui]RRB14168.1 hypothetical protein EHT87_18190 [Larkinella knui]
MILYFFLEASDSPCVCSADLETLMDVLNGFIAVGNVLSSAFLLDDDGTRIDLPVDAFDGLPMARGMHNLTKEYHSLLRVKSRA